MQLTSQVELTADYFSKCLTAPATNRWEFSLYFWRLKIWWEDFEQDMVRRYQWDIKSLQVLGHSLRNRIDKSNMTEIDRVSLCQYKITGVTALTGRMNLQCKSGIFFRLKTAIWPVIVFDKQSEKIMNQNAGKRVLQTNCEGYAHN